jgi:hypothetical protein
MKPERCNYQMCSSECKAVVELDIGYYVTQSMNTDLKYSNGPVAPVSSSVFVRTCGKEWEVD